MFREVTDLILKDQESFPLKSRFFIVQGKRVFRNSNVFFDLEEKFENKLVLMGQIHSDVIKEIDGKDIYIDNCDAIFTDKKGLSLGTYTADCVPIFIQEGNKICVVHSGWKGTLANIVGKSLKNFVKPIVFIGPCIKSCCYNINTGLGGDGRERDFLDKYGDVALRREKDNIYLDLNAVIRKQISDYGLETSVIESPICTCCYDLKLPSHYREGEKRGNVLVSVISIQS